MDGETEVAPLFGHRRLPRVHPHAHAQLDTVGPCVIRQGELGLLDGGGNLGVLGGCRKATKKKASPCVSIS